MTIRTRLIILGTCAVLFLVFAPYIVLYSLGYRVDFTNMRLRGTGGIYVYAVPEPSSILIDSKPAEKAKLFSTAVFMQNMMPGSQNVLIKKDGYYDYQKNLLVEEKEVAKLEDVILFKQNVEFTALKNSVNYLFTSLDGNKLLTAKVTARKIDFEILDLKNNQNQTVSLPVTNGKVSNIIWAQNTTKVILKISNAYYLLDTSTAKPTVTALPLLTGVNKINFNPQDTDQILFVKNKNLYISAKTLPVVKDVVAYTIEGQSITWLSYDGFLYQSDVTQTQVNKISEKAFGVKTDASYEIRMISGVTFLKENNALFSLHKDLKTFQTFYDNVKNMANSPDNQKILYYKDHQILISSVEKDHQDKILLNTYTDTIDDCYWLNDHYLVITTGNRIAISEIDNRGNINKVTLPETITDDGATPQTKSVLTTNQQIITMKNPKTFFHWQDKKLYVLSEGNLIVSEKLIP